MNIPWTQLGAGVGTLLGVINGWILLRDRQQRITIDRIPGGTSLDFRITNRTLRPIPIQGVVLRFRYKRGFGKWETMKSPPPKLIISDYQECSTQKHRDGFTGPCAM